MAKEECVEWDGPKCIKWRKVPDGKVEMDLTACPSDLREKLSDELRNRIRKGVLIKE